MDSQKAHKSAQKRTIVPSATPKPSGGWTRRWQMLGIGAQSRPKETGKLYSYSGTCASA